MPNLVRANRLPLALLSLSLAAVLSGCGIGTIDHSASGALAMTGVVHGGQQGVRGSTVQLYRVGTTGNGSAATAMLSTPLQTDANGFFNLSGGYTCVNGTDQVYMTATGGDPGLGANNPALVLIDALGNCSNLSTISYITMNEVTTAAAAWSLAPFIAGFDHIGSTATNSIGMTNAMLGAQQIADPSTGLAAVLPANLQIESAKLYALADALASCVNSDGGPGCSPLFSAATPGGGTAPSDTLSAAVSIVLHPGQNVAGVFAAITPTAPFPTTLTQPPNDWTMSLTVTGGGLSRPTALDIDALGYVWVADYSGALSAFSAQGTPLSATGFGIGTISESYGLAIDPSGSVWVSNEEIPTHSGLKGSLTKFQGVASGSPGTIVQVSGSPYIYDAATYFPYGIAADTNGNIAVAGYGHSTITLFNNSGTSIIPANFNNNNNVEFPGYLTFDQSHGLWIGSESSTNVTHWIYGGTGSNGVLLPGTFTPVVDCCGGSFAVAVDALGNAWSANYTDGSVTEIANDGTVPLQEDTDGISAPSGIAIDAAQNVWVSNYFSTTSSASFTELAGNRSSLPAGTAISPADVGYGMDASLDQPFSLRPDATGSIWISNYGSNSLVKFFGIAAPTMSPVTSSPAAP